MSAVKVVRTHEKETALLPRCCLFCLLLIDCLCPKQQQDSGTFSPACCCCDHRDACERMTRPTQGKEGKDLQRYRKKKVAPGLRSSEKIASRGLRRKSTMRPVRWAYVPKSATEATEASSTVSHLLIGGRCCDGSRGNLCGRLRGVNFIHGEQGY